MNGGLDALSLALASFQAAMVWRNLPLFQAPPAKFSSPPPISVLLPARDEEANLPEVVATVRNQVGVDWELVIVDDASTDGTRRLAEAAALEDRRIKVVLAPPLPPGWAGKQHACHLASQQARFPHWLFLDADVRLSDPQALARISALLDKGGAEMVSGLPLQKTFGWAEQAIIPLIHLVLLGYLPLWEMRRNRLPALGAACGQMVAVQAAAYRESGGHAAVHDRLHDATALAALFRRRGYMTDMFDATALADCRMYQNSRDVWSGFAKNATEGMARPLLLPLWTFVLLGANLLPLVLALTGRPLGALALLLNAAVYLALRRRFQQTILGALSRPLGVTGLMAIQWWALLDKWRGGRATWKGRAYQPRHS